MFYKQITYKVRLILTVFLSISDKSKSIIIKQTCKIRNTPHLEIHFQTISYQNVCGTQQYDLYEVSSYKQISIR